MSTEKIIVITKESSSIPSREFSNPISYVFNSGGFLKIITSSVEIVLINHDIIEEIKIQ